MAKQFFLNYGGPGGKWYSENMDTIQSLHESCIDSYVGSRTFVTWEYKGLQIKVRSYGIHRALYVTMPDEANKEAEALFNAISLKAREFSKKKYSIFSNNCVTSVAHVLSALDPRFVSSYLIFPWTLDKKIACYQKENTNNFLTTYQKKININVPYKREIRNIKTVNDIIEHSHDKNIVKRERSKSALIELGWVTEDKQGILHPTDKAPRAFYKGLTEYNQQMVTHDFYRSKAGDAASDEKSVQQGDVLGFFRKLR